MSACTSQWALHLAPGLLSGDLLHNRAVSLLGHSILQPQFLAGDFLERRLAT